jgi:hypothetical protein
MKINLYGGPGIGKSTVSSIVFSELKIRGFNVEIVHEYAKELVYEGFDLREADSNFQYRIIMEQLRRELLFQNKVEYIITDSPLFLNAFYSKEKRALNLARGHDSSENFHFYLVRSNEHFEGRGRSHSEKESLSIDKQMIRFLKKQNIVPVIIEGDSKMKAMRIVDKILEKIHA